VIENVDDFEAIVKAYGSALVRDETFALFRSRTTFSSNWTHALHLNPSKHHLTLTGPISCRL
jgi:hypothetical protein